MSLRNRAKIGDYVVVSSYIYANKKDGYKATPITDNRLDCRHCTFFK